MRKVCLVLALMIAMSASIFAASPVSASPAGAASQHVKAAAAVAIDCYVQVSSWRDQSNSKSVDAYGYTSCTSSVPYITNQIYFDHCTLYAFGNCLHWTPSWYEPSVTVYTTSFAITPTYNWVVPQGWLIRANLESCADINGVEDCSPANAGSFQF